MHCCTLKQSTVYSHSHTGSTAQHDHKSHTADELRKQAAVYPQIGERLDLLLYFADLSWLRICLKCLLVAQRASNDSGGRWKLMASTVTGGRMVMYVTLCCNTSMITETSMAVTICW